MDPVPPGAGWIPASEPANVRFVFKPNYQIQFFSGHALALDICTWCLSCWLSWCWIRYCQLSISSVFHAGWRGDNRQVARRGLMVAGRAQKRKASGGNVRLSESTSFKLFCEEILNNSSYFLKPDICLSCCMRDLYLAALVAWLLLTCCKFVQV